MQNIVYPSSFDMQLYFKQGILEELSELLHYTWDEAALKALKERGINIEVYVGEKDAIINAMAVKEFFVPYATVYYFKRVGHILKD